MRILFVAPSGSVHTARWIKQLCGQGWELHLFPSIDLGSVNPGMPPEVKNYRVYANQSRPARAFRKIKEWLPLSDQLPHLCRLIGEIKPDIIHSMEIQHGAYLTLEAKKRIGGEFPPWIVTNWGSDIYHFGKFPDHAMRIREVLSNCHYYHCECERDVRLGREFGFTGFVLPVIPNGGGFNLEQVRGLRSSLPPSKRRRIMLKGYQGWAGRALVGLQALRKCADLLACYELCVYAPEIAGEARAFERETGLKTTLVPWGTPHDEMLRLHGSARVSLGLSISDALSTSLLEAIIMGSFPVQSNTCGAAEWLEDGKTCLLVSPEDTDAVAGALRRTLTDDALVDNGSAANIVMAETKLSAATIGPMARNIYISALAGQNNPK